MAIASTPGPAGPAPPGVAIRAAGAALLAPAVTAAPSPLARLDHDPRRAIGEGAIVCLMCGRPFRQLTNSHLRRHGVTTEQYKGTFGYNARRPLMCRALQRLYIERSVRSGLASRIRERPIVARPELRAKGGRRTLAWEEVLTRFEARLRLAAARQLRGAGAARGGPRSA
jgi:predicted transcriptional regulator